MLGCCSPASSDCTPSSRVCFSSAVRRNSSSFPNGTNTPSCQIASVLVQANAGSDVHLFADPAYRRSSSDQLGTTARSVGRSATPLPEMEYSAPTNVVYPLMCLFLRDTTLDQPVADASESACCQPGVKRHDMQRTSPSGTWPVTGCLTWVPLIDFHSQLCPGQSAISGAVELHTLQCFFFPGEEDQVGFVAVVPFSDIRPCAPTEQLHGLQSSLSCRLSGASLRLPAYNHKRPSRRKRRLVLLSLAEV